ncbi:MAG: ABC transporter substrate-binding protein [Thermoanaerobacteraceae bacterium]|nr:ABC transporter substrate-binding protein [Thermoanaerobacteraceae bacterium]
MRTLRLILICLLAFLIVLSSVGCSTQPKLIKLNYIETVRSIFYAPVYVAINKGFFKEEGLDINLTTAQGSDKAMTAILSGTADFGLQGPETTVYVYSQGREDYAINFAQVTKRDGSFLVGREAEPDFKWENLKGKTIIGGRPGGMPEMVLEWVLKDHDLIPGKDVNVITNLQFTATAGAFQSQPNVDYVALFEPTASIMEKIGEGKIVASLGVAGGEVPYTAFAAKKSYIEKNPDIIQKVTNALYKGQLWVRDHSSREIAEAIASFFPDADLDLIETVVTRYKEQDTWPYTPIVSKEGLDHLQDFIITSGELKGGKIDSSKIIDNTFANKAVETVK